MLTGVTETRLNRLRHLLEAGIIASDILLLLLHENEPSMMGITDTAGRHLRTEEPEITRDLLRDAMSIGEGGGMSPLIVIVSMKEMGMGDYRRATGIGHRI